MIDRPTSLWQVIVPVKRATAAKSRLVVPRGVDHTQLARALALDTLSAVLDCPGVRCVVVSGDATTSEWAADRGAVAVPEAAAGLNGSIKHGLRMCQRGPVAVLLGDLPTLRGDDLLAALQAAARHSTAFVPDAAGTGTVLLSAALPRLLRPRFGPGSARAHARGSVPIGLDLPRLRHDVDTRADLVMALALGVGAYTTAALGQAEPPRPPCRRTSQAPARVPVHPLG